MMCGLIFDLREIKALQESEDSHHVSACVQDVSNVAAVQDKQFVYLSLSLYFVISQTLLDMVNVLTRRLFV